MEGINYVLLLPAAAASRRGPPACIWRRTDARWLLGLAMLVATYEVAMHFALPLPGRRLPHAQPHIQNVRCSLTCHMCVGGHICQCFNTCAARTHGRYARAVTLHCDLSPEADMLRWSWIMVVRVFHAASV